MSPTDATNSRIQDIIDGMPPELRVAQLLCPNTRQAPLEEVEALVRTWRPGSLFINSASGERYRGIASVAAKASEVAPLITADLVNGAGSRIEGALVFPWQMAMGAADSETLVETMGEATAHEGRAHGVHWTLAPVADLHLNPNSASIYARSFGSQTEPVARLVRAFVRGVQKDRLMAATAKHFPGDGYDDRDPHLSLPSNSLPRDDWVASYGAVWRAAIDEGVMAIMPGHIGLPFIDPGDKPFHAPPATFSRKVLVDFLRGELGFEGVLISDAMEMCGVSSLVPQDKLAPTALAAGIDVILFSRPEIDHPAILAALDRGELTLDRIDEALARVLTIKQRLGLLDGAAAPEPSDEQRRRWRECIEAASAHSMTVLRDDNDLLPLKLAPGGEVLTVTIVQEHVQLRGMVKRLDAVDDALRARGHDVTHLDNPTSDELVETDLSRYEAIFVNLHFPPNYGTSRLGWKGFLTLVRSFWVRHPRVVFTSWCDPYKVYELNHVPVMVNAYSNNVEAQEAVVKVWLGEAEPLGKNPVGLKGYFEPGV